MLEDSTLDFFCLNSKQYKLSELDKVELNINSKKIYEVIRVVNSKSLFLNEHISRMKVSLKLEKINYIILNDDLEKDISDLIISNNIVNNNIKIIIFTDNNNIKTLIYPTLSNYPTLEKYKVGVKVSLINEERKNPNAKVLNNEFKQRIAKKLKENNSYELLLVNKRNLITEGSKSNLFFIKDGEIITSLSKDVLMGITRMKLIEMLNAMNIKITQREIFVSELNSFDGAFITGTSINALPINQIDDISINTCNNEIYMKINQNFNKKICEL